MGQQVVIDHKTVRGQVDDLAPKAVERVGIGAGRVPADHVDARAREVLLQQSVAVAALAGIIAHPVARRLALVGPVDDDGVVPGGRDLGLDDPKVVRRIAPRAVVDGQPLAVGGQGKGVQVEVAVRPGVRAAVKVHIDGVLLPAGAESGDLDAVKDPAGRQLVGRAARARTGHSRSGHRGRSARARRAPGRGAPAIGRTHLAPRGPRRRAGCCR